MTQRREVRTAYIEWAKLRAATRFNLASSNVQNFPLWKLPARIEDLDISGPGGYGYEPLLKRLAEKCGVARENVVHAVGTSMANHLATAALLEPGDEVLIEEPTYEPILAVASYLSARIRRFSRRFEDGFQIDPREVERSITPRTRMVILTNLHNPSGVRTPDSVLRLVGEIARSLGANVLVDEVYLEACFEPGARSAFHLGPNFVATSSLTKAYGLSGLRCGWILAAPALATRIWRLNDLFGNLHAHAAERLSCIALDHLNMIMAEAKLLLDRNRSLVAAFLASRSDLMCPPPQFGTVVFPQVLRGRGDSFCQLLREKYETSVVPGRFFEMPDHFRLGYGGDTETLRQGLERIGNALDEIAAR